MDDMAGAVARHPSSHPVDPLDPPTPLVRPPEVDERLVLPGGTYRVRHWDYPPVAVVTELEDNPGRSVTNNAEAVYAAVRERWTNQDLTVVEHYPPRAIHHEHTLDLVLVNESGVAYWVPLQRMRDRSLANWIREVVIRSEAM